MAERAATALAHPNIAFIKYWGNHDPQLRIPSNGSISMNLDGLYTRTHVAFESSLLSDHLTINYRSISGAGLERVSIVLERVRQLAGLRLFAHITSENNFPTGAGLASSASAFAALSLAAAHAAGLELAEKDLSRLARLGSGSACRSVPGGFVEWQAGQGDLDSFAFSIAPPQHWDLVDCIALVSESYKPTGSTEGHALADTSPLQNARVTDAPRRLEICRHAILGHDFEALADMSELDCNLMHAVMITSSPRLLYWQPATMAVIHAVQTWRADGLPVFYTIDAGPNVHVFCTADQTDKVIACLAQVPGVERILTALPGGPAYWQSPDEL